MNLKIIIETPKNCPIKYKWEPETNTFKVKRTLPIGMIFPYAFGFISGTKGEDGDPLDAMVISNDAYFTGCHMEARLIGALEAEQKEKGKKKFRNDRYFFVPAGDDDLLFRHIKSIHDFGNEHNRQLTEFFINYNRLAGKLFKPMKLLSATEAASLLRKSNQQS